MGGEPTLGALSSAARCGSSIAALSILFSRRGGPAGRPRRARAQAAPSVREGLGSSSRPSKKSDAQLTTSCQVHGPRRPRIQHAQPRERMRAAESADKGSPSASGLGDAVGQRQQRPIIIIVLRPQSRRRRSVEQQGQPDSRDDLCPYGHHARKDSPPRSRRADDRRWRTSSGCLRVCSMLGLWARRVPSERPTTGKMGKDREPHR